jgi:hypothetical protein
MANSGRKAAVSNERSLIVGLLSTGGVGGIWVAIHAAAPDGVHLSAGALAITTILLLLMAGAVSFLFGMLIAALNAQIADLKRLAFRGTDVAAEAVKELAAKEGS